MPYITYEKECRKKRRYIYYMLKKNGYVTYAELFAKIPKLELTSDPSLIGCINPSTKVMTINRTISDELTSTVVRHEILHDFLRHQLRMIQHIGQGNYDARSAKLHQIMNIAMDYEISNRAYTKRDKELLRHIEIGGRLVKALVTEDKHPNWVNWTMEQMYDELTKRIKDDQQKAQQQKSKQPQNSDSSDQDNNNQSSQGGSGGQSDSNEQSGEQDTNSNSSSGENSENDNQSSSQDSKEDDASSSQDSSKDAKSKSDDKSDAQESDGEGNSNEDDDLSDLFNDPSNDSDDKSSQSDDEDDDLSDLFGDPNDSDSDSSDYSDSNEEDEFDDYESKPKIGDAGDAEFQERERAQRKQKDDEERQKNPHVDDDDPEDAIPYDELSDEERAKLYGDALDNIDGGFIDKEAEVANRKEAERINRERNRPANVMSKRDIMRSHTGTLEKTDSIQQVINDMKKFLENYAKNPKAQIVSPSINPVLYSQTGASSPWIGVKNNKRIPQIDMYFDMSYSWHEYRKLSELIQASLQDLEQKKLLKINPFYFSVKVHTDAQSAIDEGGTRGQPILDNIKNITHADNAFILTDDDITDCTSNLELNGGVWMLFRGAYSDNLRASLHGSKMTKHYLMTRSDLEKAGGINK